MLECPVLRSADVRLNGESTTATAGGGPRSGPLRLDHRETIPVSAQAGPAPVMVCAPARGSRPLSARRYRGTTRPGWRWRSRCRSSSKSRTSRPKARNSSSVASLPGGRQREFGDQLAVRQNHSSRYLDRGIHAYARSQCPQIAGSWERPLKVVSVTGICPPLPPLLPLPRPPGSAAIDRYARQRLYFSLGSRMGREHFVRYRRAGGHARQSAPFLVEFRKNEPR